MMTTLRISYALIVGCGPSTKNCCIHRHDTMLQGLVKRMTQQWLGPYLRTPSAAKKLKPAASGTRFTEWIRGICCADTLQVWFPPHWAPWYCTSCNKRIMQFKVGDYKDSNICMLTGTLKADWIQLPVERYSAALPTLKQSVIVGVFKITGASPCAITRAEKLQVSVFLPNDLSLDARFHSPPKR